MRANVSRFSLADPSDVSGLADALAAGKLRARDIVAVIGKTHGNGLINDYTRGYLTLSLALLIGTHTGETAEQVRARIPFVFSGGVEGVLSPHYSVFTVSEDDAPPRGKALAIGVAFTPDFESSDIGRQQQINSTAEAVVEAMRGAGIASPDDVHFVQVKGPAFGLADIVDSRQKGRPPVSDNPGKLMGHGRAASAIGVAKALGEIPPGKAIAEAVLSDFTLYSAVASCSAGVEVRANEVIVLGLSDRWSGPLIISHAPMRDALDGAGVHQVLQAIGLDASPQLSAAKAARIKAGFVKCEASRDGLIRGKGHTMLNDGDIDQQRHIRAAVGAVVASIVNDTALFVSGGAEHQGPDGGGLVALIAERDADQPRREMP